ncbi:MAG: hypothetical protein ACD_11C00134G0001 [uncultured bacterium]|nr:MAG: hypothetical protein ACD_11C00134G0001 [uncultured bacterium]
MIKIQLNKYLSRVMVEYWLNDPSGNRFEMTFEKGCPFQLGLLTYFVAVIPEKR